MSRVQRVDGPAPGVVVLGLYHPDRGRTILRFDAATSDVVRCGERPRGNPADSFVRRLRKLLTGAHLIAVERRGRVVRLRFRAGDREFVLGGEARRAVLRTLEGHPLAARQRVAKSALETDWVEVPWEELRETDAAPVDQHRPLPVLRQLKSARKRLERKLRAIEGDIARAAKAPELREEAQLITAHLSAYRPGGDSLEVRSWTDGTTRRIAIDPSKGASACADDLFRRAKRFERGAELARPRADEVRAQLDALAALVSELADREDLDDALQERVAAFLRPQQTAPGKRPRPRRSFREFRGHSDQRILVGRGASDNDRLTLAAKPHHHWLHARGARGAHVLVPLAKGKTIGSELLADAAMLAAHFSQRKADAIVEVQHTPRRYVRKPKGWAAGAVRVDREKVIAVRMDPQRIRWLLERER
ncbi:MAG: NFACT RNA binding domain-containing protein [Myxococcota bacterium]